MRKVLKQWESKWEATMKGVFYDDFLKTAMSNEREKAMLSITLEWNSFTIIRDDVR